MNEYQLQILEHYKKPLNWGKPDWEPTHTAHLENTQCGDELIVYLKVEGNVITDAHFEGEGCSISIASASLLSEKLKGKEIDSVKKLTEDFILNLLRIELTPTRKKCAKLSLECTQKSLEN